MKDSFLNAYLKIIFEQNEELTGEKIINELKEARPDLKGGAGLFLTLGMFGESSREGELLDLLKKDGHFESYDDGVDDNLNEFRELLIALDKINWLVSFKDFNSMSSMKTLLLKAVYDNTYYERMRQSISRDYSALIKLFSIDYFHKLERKPIDYYPNTSSGFVPDEYYLAYVKNLKRYFSEKTVGANVVGMIANDNDRFKEEKLVLEILKLLENHDAIVDIMNSALYQVQNHSDEFLKFCSDLNDTTISQHLCKFIKDEDQINKIIKKSEARQKDATPGSKLAFLAKNENLSEEQRLSIFKIAKRIKR